MAAKERFHHESLPFTYGYDDFVGDDERLYAEAKFSADFGPWKTGYSQPKNNWLQVNTTEKRITEYCSPSDGNCPDSVVVNEFKY